MKNQDIFTIKRKIFLNKRIYSHAWARALITRDQLIDIGAVVGGLLLVFLLLSF
jgi:hypothetical protein